MSDERNFFHVSLKAFLRNPEGKILAFHTKFNDAFAGKLDLPGGRINRKEYGTPLLDILKREILEEIGTDAVTVHPRPIALGRHTVAPKNGPVRIFYVYFEVEFHGDSIRISEEHQGYEWVDLTTIDLEQYFTSGILDGVRQYIERTQSTR